jgi:hypothetical protein
MNGEEIVQIPKREFVRRGIKQPTLEKIGKRQPVRASRFTKCLRILEETEWEEGDNRD